MGTTDTAQFVAAQASNTRTACQIRKDGQAWTHRETPCWRCPEQVPQQHWLAEIGKPCSLPSADHLIEDVSTRHHEILNRASLVVKRDSVLFGCDGRLHIAQAAVLLQRIDISRPGPCILLGACMNGY